MPADLVHLWRSLRRSPASAVAAILTLTLTLGAGGSIFALVDAVVLTPPPFTDPDALVVIGETPLEAAAAASRAVGRATFEAWRERVAHMAKLEAIDGTNLTLTGLGSAERVNANDVTPGFLALLGVTPVIGRAFAIADIGQPVIIVSHAFWRAKLAADPRVIGRSIVLGAEPHVIVGVLPEQFIYELSPADVWRPRAASRVGVVARLGPHVSPATLASVLVEVSRTSSPPGRVVVTPVATAISRDATRTLALLAGAAGLAVLIAFTNFAGLLIVRSIDRRRELAVRSALGARRAEIAKQLLLEAQTLAALGIVGGVMVALWITPAAKRLALEQFGGVAQRDVAVSWPLIALVAAAASVCAWICALIPAVMAERVSVVDVLRPGSTSPRRELLLRRVFVSGEVALAFVLLACVTLLAGGLIRLLKVDPGFDARGVLALQVSVPAASYTQERTAAFYAALQNALGEPLGAHSAAIVNEIPLTGDSGRELVSVRAGDPGREAVMREAGPSYFDVMRMTTIAGRTFESHDDVSAPLRVVISESLAKRLFATEQSIGRAMWLAQKGHTAEIIGVVGDVKHRALDEPALPTIYISALQTPSRSSIVVVRSARMDGEVVATVREEVARLDSNLPVYRVRSMEDVVAASPGMPARRVLTATFMAFAVLALILGAIGLFGVAAHDVASRRTELALRVALGADPGRILGATVAQGMVMIGAGLAAGGLLSIWAARLLGQIGIANDGLDTLSAGLPAAILLAAGLAAVLPVARRAARTDPMAVLRGE